MDRVEFFKVFLCIELVGLQGPDEPILTLFVRPKVQYTNYCSKSGKYVNIQGSVSVVEHLLHFFVHTLVKF